MHDPIWDSPSLLTFISSYRYRERDGIRRVMILYHVAERLVVRRRDVRKSLKSSFEATRNRAGQAAVENLKILIAEAVRCSDYDLVIRLERILKKVEVLIHNLQAGGRGDTPQIGASKQAPFEASSPATLRGAPSRAALHGLPEPDDTDRLAPLRADRAARSRLPSKPRPRHH